MKSIRGKVAAIAATAALCTGGIMPATALAADDTAEASATTTTVTPNPWFANGPFEGWGTSLAWLANATGGYGEPGSLTQSSGDDAADAKALEYGKQLREEFYQSIFGSEGLDLNMARYNIGGGNASDVAYGYPFMRQGAAVPGYWAEDRSGELGLYGGVGTKQADKDKLDEAFDANDDNSYVWGEQNKDSQAAQNVLAQEWWLQRAAQDGDITHVEAFANSAPWFMTNSGYATGSWNAGDDGIKDTKKFAEYMAKVVQYLNTLKAENGNSVHVDTVEPFNESETNYWGTPDETASDYADGSDDNAKLIQRYWGRYYQDKDQSVTPYTSATKKPQEGMHVDNDSAQATLLALREALTANGVDTNIAATDATDSGQLVDAYNKFPQNVRDVIDQFNTHSYGTNKQRVARDIAQGDTKKLSMSEVDGSWQGGGFNPYGFDNGLGMAGKINSDVYALQSKDFTFWQVVEDLYNMSTSDTDVNGNAANPQGENTNWGTVLIDFDCTVAGKDGQLYSERAVDNNGGKTEGIKPCSVVVNSKYNAVRAYTKLIHEGDAIIANNATADNMTSASADGKTQTVVHRNNGSAAQKLVIDLSKYADISSAAAGKLFLTTAPEAKDDTYAATMEYMNQYSNQEQSADAVVIDAAAKTATVTVPARSIASIQLTGVSGIAEGAEAVSDGGTYQIIGKQSGKALAAKTVDDSALSLVDKATDSSAVSSQLWKFNKIDMSQTARPTVQAYVIQNSDGKVLVAKNGTNAFADMTLDEAKADSSARWILNTEDGEQWQLANASAKQSLDVNGQSTKAGAKVGLYESSAAANQTWTIRDTKATGVKNIIVQTPVGQVPDMPETVTPYYTWGEGESASVAWDTAAFEEQVKAAGTYQVSGTATDVFGNVLDVTAEVYVGAFTVTDPVSVTVGVGSSLDEVKAATPTTANAHVGASPAFAADVTWNWDGISDDDFAETGTVKVSGTVNDGTDNTIAASLTVYVTETETANGDNLAVEFCKNAKASSTEGSNTVTNTCDGNVDNKAWSNWKDASSADDKDPWLSYTFDKGYKLHSLDFVSFGEATPASFTVQYLDAAGDWKDSDITAETGTQINRGDVTSADLNTLPETSGIRLKLTYRGDSNYYAKVSEVRIFGEETHAQPASDPTLGDLRLDGTQIDGFKPAKTEYTVKLPYDAERNPVLQAYAMDNAADLMVTWERPESGEGTENAAASRIGARATVSDGTVFDGTVFDNTVEDAVAKASSDIPQLGGKAIITPTSADGTKTQITTVNFEPTAALTSLEVGAPTKNTYEIGDKLDTTGMKVTAIYTTTGGEQESKDIALNDPQLSITGFDSSVAGEKTVTVSYRGVSAEFEVTVKEAATTPGPDPEKPNPGNGNNSGGDSSASGSHSGSLSNTGSAVAVIVVIAGVALIIGGIVLALRHRRS